ncbi:PQQ-binding-like beta-propeller repeat protein [Stigmatella sp. ncwal1]|uniref:PQQ-binding-like beta-propeller repeat protein n=1 Tax=Stigmatella ashevillensis TaxID=2995309 RepID=A0ABT5DK85_9BACT|nr:PQQ-binding-like beta-propeller repeat protein [Stigmatella ashevillena]MDC0714071.1 PQQ-binding-like beta-propeller repeat protein [Stigmatella ashevillena]
MLPRACPCTLLWLVLLMTGTAGCQRPAERRFEFSPNASSRSGLVALEDSVLVGTETGALLRLDRTGRPGWRLKFAQEIASRPVRAGNTVIVGTTGGELIRLETKNAQERWHLTGEPPLLTDLVADEASVYVLDSEGAVRAHALDTGQVRWRRPAPKRETPPAQPTPRLPPPILVEGTLVVAQGDSGLVALSPEDGALRWRHPVEQVLGLAREAETLYVTTRTGRVVALNALDGTLRWEKQHASLLTSPPTVALGKLWVGAEPIQLLALSPASGETLSSTDLPAPLVTRLAIRGEWLLIPTSGREGRLLALNSQGMAPLFSLQADTPLRTEPVLIEDQLFVVGLDGRVLSWTLRDPKP